MIIIGYPGIGKTTLAYQKKGYIDFDSSNFRLGEKRCAYWNIYTCMKFVSTVGGAPLSAIKQYIENQKTSQRQ